MYSTILVEFFSTLIFFLVQEILNATVSHKATLHTLIDNSEELQLVELPGWAGLGGVRLLPHFLSFE